MIARPIPLLILSYSFAAVIAAGVYFWVGPVWLAALALWMFGPLFVVGLGLLQMRWDARPASVADHLRPARRDPAALASSSPLSGD